MSNPNPNTRFLPTLTEVVKQRPDAVDSAQAMHHADPLVAPLSGPPSDTSNDLSQRESSLRDAIQAVVRHELDRAAEHIQAQVVRLLAEHVAATDTPVPTVESSEA
jgi:hypothetical protein